MKIYRFEDIISWKKSQELARISYKLFGKCKDYSFKDQILRSCISISNNIAEGFERMTDNEFIHFLYISRGSCGELRSMLYLAKDLGYISIKDFEITYNFSIEISRLIYYLIKSLNKK